MAFRLHSFVEETFTTTGAGAITLGGASNARRKTFASELSNGDTCFYAAEGGSDYEEGLGTYSGGELTRTAVFKSSNSNNAVDWPAGLKTIRIAPLGLSDLDAAGLAACRDLLMATAFTDVASATTTDIGGVASLHVNITGTTTITGFGTAPAGVWRIGKFAGALTLTHNGTSLILPGAADITTAAGDRFIAVSLGSGNWLVASYIPAAGLIRNPGSNGMVARTEAQTTAARTITGTANQIDVTNGNGVSGNPAIGWASTINYTGSLTFNRASATPLGINRTGNDGILITFQRDGSNKGNISVSSGLVTLNGAHLSRWSQWGAGCEPPATPPRGTVLSNLDEKCAWIAERWIDRETGAQRHELYKGKLKPGDRYVDEAGQDTEIVREDNEQLNRVKVSDVDADPDFAGILDTIDDDGDLMVAGRGEFIVRIGKGVKVARGDLLVSAGDGTARPVAGDEAVTLNLLKAIIGKVMTPEVATVYPDGSYLVPVML